MSENNPLKEIRKRNQLTQSETATLLGMSLRSYKYYENDPSKRETLKYKAILKILEDRFKLDEEHGILSLEEIKETVARVFEVHDVNFCYLFGSYAKGCPEELSDVDLLIDTNVDGLKFFGLAEELRETLHKKVDLLNLRQLFNNEELLKEILKYGIKIYG